MKSKTSVLIVIDSFYDGGAEIFAIRLANELKNYINVYFLELRPECSSIKDHLNLLDKAIPLFQPKINLPKFLTKIQTKYKDYIISNFLSKNRIKIINSHCWETDYYFSKMKRMHDFKLVSSFHGHYEIFDKLKKTFFEDTKKILSEVDKVVYLTTKHLQTMRKFDYPESKTIKIFYGLAFKETDKITTFTFSDLLKLCIISRAIPEKGWEEAIKAVIKLNTESKGVNQITLTLVGGGDFLDYLMKTYHEHDYIIFEGYQSDVAKYIKNSHLCMLPSTYKAESLPCAIIEYLAKGKAVIATDVGAIPEMIAYGQDIAGTIIPLKEGALMVDDLIIAIKKYIDNPELVEIQSSIAINASKKFKMDKCVDAYLQLYDSLV